MNSLMDKKDVAKYLGVSMRTVQRLTSIRAIPFVKIPTGRSVRYDAEQIKRWVQCNTTIERSR